MTKEKETASIQGFLQGSYQKAVKVKLIVKNQLKIN